MVALWSSSLSPMTVLPKLIRGPGSRSTWLQARRGGRSPNDRSLVELESDHLLVLVEPSSDVLVGIPVMGHSRVGEQVRVPTFP